MIKFIYFDVGGVVIQDFSGTYKWEELKAELGVNKDNSQKFDDVWAIYDNEICVTRKVNSLVPILNREVGLNIPLDYSLLGGFVNRFEKNESIWPVVGKAKKKYRIGLLTNMYLGMFEKIQVKGILPPVGFDVIVDSSQVKLQKPDEEIFRLAEKLAGVSGSEILFVENSKMHVEAANELGWQTFLYNSSDVTGSSQELLKFI